VLIVPQLSSDGTKALSRKRLDDAAFSALTIPVDVAVSGGLRPSGQEILGRLYIVGHYVPGLVVGEDADSPTWRLGIEPPAVAPTLAVDTTPTGGTGLTGPALGRWRFAHKRDGRLIAASPMGPVSNLINLVSQARKWTNQPKNASVRVTHLQAMLSQNGGLFRLAWELEIGAMGSSFTETVPTLALGDAADEDAQPMVSAEIMAVYAQRAWYARFGKDKYRVAFSAPNDPEIIDGFVETLDRSPVVGLGPRSDELILFGAHSMQAVRGFTASDFVVHFVHHSIGTVSHHGIDNIHDQLWFPYLDGVYVYNGGIPFNAAEAIKPLWESDFKANPTAYYDSIAYHDDFKSIYKLLAPRTESPKSVWWIGNYHDFYRGEGEVMWMVDARNRDDVQGLLSRQIGDTVVVSATDKFVRKEDVATNGDDDGDTYNKLLIVRHGVNFFGTPGGMNEEGKSYPLLYTFLESELTAWRLNVIAGDNTGIVQAMRPDNILAWWKEDVAASALTETRDIGGVDHDLVFTPKDAHIHYPQRVSGNGLLIEVRATAPKGLVYYGYGGWWVPGPTGRPPASDDPEGGAPVGGGGGFGDTPPPSEGE